MICSHQSDAFEEKGRSLVAHCVDKKVEHPHCTLRNLRVRWQDRNGRTGKLLIEPFGEGSVSAETPPPDLRDPFQSPSKDLFPPRTPLSPLLIFLLRRGGSHCLDFAQCSTEEVAHKASLHIRKIVDNKPCDFLSSLQPREPNLFSIDLETVRQDGRSEGSRKLFYWHSARKWHSSFQKDCRLCIA